MAEKCLELVEQVTSWRYIRVKMSQRLYDLKILVGRPVISIECFEDSL